jgi:hypothetical protein
LISPNETFIKYQLQIFIGNKKEAFLPQFANFIPDIPNDGPSPGVNFFLFDGDPTFGSELLPPGTFAV